MSSLPLSARIPTPAPPVIPPDSADLVWRPATLADVHAIRDCEVAIAAADHPHYITTVEELEEDFEHSYVDTAHDTLIALEGDEVVAWGLVLMPPGQDTLVRVIVAGGVRPSHRTRGIGRQLLAWQEARGMQRLAESDKTLPGWLMAFAEERAESAHHLFARFRFAPARYFLELARSLDEDILSPNLPAGLRVVPFSAEISSAVLEARNDAFRDHWGSQPTSPEQWEAFVGRSTFRADLCSIALDGDRVAGLVIVSVNEEDWPGQGFSSGYIELVGVARAWRGRGIAPALLARSLSLMAAASLDKAVLDVDSDSPTGAVGLYTGLGFAESNRSISYNRIF